MLAVAAMGERTQDLPAPPKGGKFQSLLAGARKESVSTLHHCDSPGMQPDKLTTQRFIMPFHLLTAATVTPHRPLQNGISPGINLGQAHWDIQIVSETKLILTETTCASSLQPGSSHLRAPAAQGDRAGLFAAHWEPGWGEPRHTGARCRNMLPPAGPSLPQFPISRSGQQHLARWQSPLGSTRWMLCPAGMLWGCGERFCSTLLSQDCSPKCQATGLTVRVASNTVQLVERQVAR